MRIPVWFVAAAIIVMSLLTGVIVGVAVDRRMLLHRGPYFFRTFGERHSVMIPGHLEHELGLSPAQTAAVDSIIRHRMAQRDSLMTHTWPVMRLLLDSTRTDIERILTPAQREKFEHLREADGPVMMRRGPGGEVMIRTGDGPLPPPPMP